MPGKYQVSVSKVKSTAGEPGQASGNPSAAPSAPEHLLPVKYLSAASSGLECTVTEQPDQVVELKLD